MKLRAVRKKDGKEIDVVLVDIEEQFLETWEEGELCEYSLDEVVFPDYKGLNFVCRLKQQMKKFVDTKLEELMPTQSGFFFGGTDYCPCYFDDVKETLEIANKVLENGDFDKEVYLYHSSW